MKKNKMIIMGLILTTLLSACGNSRMPGSETAQTTQNISVEGRELFDVAERGIRFEIPREYQDLGVQVEPCNENIKGYKCAFVYYYSPTSKKLLDEVISMNTEDRTREIEDEYTQKIMDTSRCLMEVAIVEEEEYKNLINNGASDDDFTYNSPAEYFGTNDGYAYIVSIPELDDGALNTQEIEDYHKCKGYMTTVKNNIAYMPVQLESDETVVGEVMPEINTTDINGNKVTSDIFANKEITVVNIWGTFCGPCIEEMPELEEMSKELGDRAQLIGIVGDIEGTADNEHLELAKKIVDKAGVSFINLIPNDDFDDLMSGIIGFPTTIFVDSNGNIIGDPIVGTDVEATKMFVKDYLG
ncbi:MAG: TlpA family protein disulfide reductase [Acetatifactor sp.]|nr:TlpA family protein disulfide reductase [Acetatifactor sp.]